MKFEELLKDERFSNKLEKGQISQTFINEVKANCFEDELIERLISAEYEDLSEFDKDILSGKIIWDIDPIKIPIKKFNKELCDYLKKLGFTDKKISSLSKEICEIYKNINSIVAKKFEVNGIASFLIISDVCLFKAEDVTLDIQEVNKHIDWAKPGFILFAWTEDGGAMYFDIAGEKTSIYWCDHETDEMFLVADNCKEFVDIFCS